jgi:hypothetical protein
VVGLWLVRPSQCFFVRVNYRSLNVRHSPGPGPIIIRTLASSCRSSSFIRFLEPSLNPIQSPYTAPSQLVHAPPSIYPSVLLLPSFALEFDQRCTCRLIPHLLNSISRPRLDGVQADPQELKDVQTDPLPPVALVILLPRS